MDKNKKFLIATICGLLLLIIGVLAQSIIRRHQEDQVLASIKKSVAQADSKEGKKKALTIALNERRSDIEFILTHRPILDLNIEINGVKAEWQGGEDTSLICEYIIDWMLHPGDYGWEDDNPYVVNMSLRMMAIFECAI